MKLQSVLVFWIAFWNSVFVKGALELKAQHVPEFNRKISTITRFNRDVQYIGLEKQKQSHSNGRCSGETRDILENIRHLMHNSSDPLQAYIVLMNDAHQSEYISERDMRIKFISKFTGSSGKAVINDTHAHLWTDSRYHQQAESQIDEKCWTLMKEGQEDVPPLNKWLITNLPVNSTVGVDPFVISSNYFQSIKEELNTNGHELLSIEPNLVDEVWENRPEPSQNEIIPLSIKYSGKSAGVKIHEIRLKLIQEYKASGIIVTALDDIAWILNLRGSDIKYNPVFYSYLIITRRNLFFFVDEQKLLNQTLLQLFEESVDYSLRKYEEISLGIKEVVNNTSGQIIISSEASQAIYQQIPNERRLVVPNIIAEMKAVKNSIEALGLEKAHIRDGFAVVRYLHWLDSIIDMENVTEVTGAEKLAEFREQLENYRGPSFKTVSGVGPHAAMPHYSPTPETATQITRDEIYLVDSGGQYWDGTTDITRTVHFGEPTAEEVECFTRVLKGFIAVVTSVFPRNTESKYLDFVARRALWQVGLNYGHGTGHGIGSYLLVHEYPPSINSASQRKLQENMFTSNEPGYYKDGKFGFRIEDIVQVVNASISNAFDGSGALRLRTITYVPLQTKLIDKKILTKNEICFINNYNKRVFKTLGPQLLEKDLKETYEWLRNETIEILL